MPVSPGAQVTTEEVLAFLHKHHPQIVAFPSREALAAALVGAPIELETMGDGWRVTPKMAQNLVAHLWPEAK